MKKLLYLCFLTGFCWAQLALTIDSRPSGANVSIDGSAIGKTPVENSKISIGHHQIMLSKDGYATIEYEIDVTPAKSLSLDFQLNKLHMVTFKTNEQGLTFKINEGHSWSSKKEKFFMETGDHFLEVFREGTLIDTREFTINQPTEINFKLE